MKIETVKVRASAGKRATVDLVVMALFASLGLASKNVIHPLVATLAGPLYIPTGALAGGFYMMWPVLAFGFVRKIGAATVTSLTQAFISLLLPFGNFGLLSFVIYLAPGLAIDGFFLLSRHKACCAACCMGAAAVANVVGTVLVGMLILVLPEVVLLFIALVAAVSGSLGGVLANMLLVRTQKLGLRNSGG
ncbi:MAG: ECF transporter S component [Candidatus Bathyarchaeota archaeon]|nr:ECF transporter S component [Candidatus Bathyarchaeota archaeon]